MILKAKTTDRIILTRVFHGVYRKGRNICYYKPTPRKTGPLWVDNHYDPKLKKRVYYTLYGGKLAGILTQSFCRELFFASLLEMKELFELEGVTNVKIVGQFHDEIVVDWVPGSHPLDEVREMMAQAMSKTHSDIVNFPLVADIKQGYRYIK